MTGLAIMLKAFGINVSEEHIKNLEVIIPQIPAKLQEAANAINAAIARNEIALEDMRRELSELKEVINGQSRSDGTGGNRAATRSVRSIATGSGD